MPDGRQGRLAATAAGRGEAGRGDGSNSNDFRRIRFTVTAKKVALPPRISPDGNPARGRVVGDHDANTGTRTMFDRSIVTLGLAAALAAFALNTPAKAEPVAGLFAAGFVGAVFGAGIASARHRDIVLHDGYAAWDYGVPGYQRPRPAYVPASPTGYALVEAPGPGRHRVCARQDRFDRREHYIGSRRICWIEAR